MPDVRPMISRSLLVLLLLTLTSCGESTSDRMSGETPPAAAFRLSGGEVDRLSDELSALQEELERVATGESERLLNAEAITDRLLHAERPVDWLATRYDVEARLRQIQSMADGLVARLRRGASMERVEQELAILRESVRDLQAQLSEPGGGRAPPPLDSLLAQDPLRDVTAPSLGDGADEVSAEDTVQIAEPRVDTESGILGTPVPVRPDTVPGATAPRAP